MKQTRRKIRYCKLPIKVSDKEQREIDRYCSALGLTPNKMLKRSLREFMARNAHRIPEASLPVSKNQLRLFETVPQHPVQLTILDGIADTLRERSA